MAMMYGGMLYFPLKVNLFEEIAVELVEARFGLKGTAAVMKLLCKIHKENGYYLKWNTEQCTLFMAACSYATLVPVTAAVKSFTIFVF